MWKKRIVLFLAFIGCFSVVYASENFLYASEEVYIAGGNVTGRINKAPSGISGSNIGMQKGDKVLLGIANPLNGKPFGMQLVTFTSGYTDYTTNYGESPVESDPVDAWISLANEEITEPIQYADSIGIEKMTTGVGYYLKYSSVGENYYWTYKLAETIPYTSIKNLSIQMNELSINILAPRNISYLRDNSSDALYKGIMVENTKTYIGKEFFTLSPSEKGHIWGLTERLFSIQDLKFTKNYWYDDSYPFSSGTKGWSNPPQKFYGDFIRSDGKSNLNSDEEYSLSNKAVVRPTAYLDMTKVVFGISPGTDGGFASVTEEKLPASYNALYEQGGSEMKLRVQDDHDPIQTPQFTDLLNTLNTSTTKVGLDEKVNIKAKAENKGTTISVLVFNERNEFVYYRPLASAKGNDKDYIYEFNTAGMFPGKYKIAVVNEVYNDNSTEPANCSAISETHALEIVAPISDLNFTGTESLEYGKNVNEGDSVGTIASENGVGSPTYKLVADNDHTSDVTHFELDTDGKTVIVKGNALEVGTYHFKIQAQDSNGNPTTPLEISASITVAKTDPNLKFSTTNAIDKVVGDSAFTETFTHKNTDTSDSNFKLTYSSSLTNIADVDTPNGINDTDIEITPKSTDGTTTIKVELAETKNFKSANATLTVNVHPKIALSFTPDKNSFAVSDVATNGTKIGSVSLTGNSPQYTYSMAVDPNHPNDGTDNASFNVRSTAMTNDTSMDIITNSPSIPQGTYKITIKVEDAYGQVAYAKGTITISGIAQTGFDFYDYTDTSKKITDKTLEIYYGETGAKLFAKGGQSSGLTYAPDDPTQTILTIDPTNGTIVTNDIGKVKVKAIKPADGTYSEAVIYMYVEVKPCEQEISFDKAGTTTISYDNTNGNTFSETATGKIKMGMPNAGHAGEGTTEYILGGTDKDIASIDLSGNITINAGQNITSMKSFTVTAKLNDGNTKNPKYGSASKTKTINVYPPGSATWNQTHKPQADNNTGTEKIGDLTVSGGSGNASFSISTSGDADNLDKEFFYIDPTSGEVTLIKTITVSDITSKTYNTTEKAYEMRVMIDITDGGNTTTEHLTIYIKGAERTNLDFKNKDLITQEITETYDINKSFHLSLNQNITGTTYGISTNPAYSSPSDVITVDTNGKTDIQNANEVSVAGSTTAPVYVEAVVPPSNGYMEMVIEAPVRIKRAAQALTFSQDPINTSADIQSLNITMSGHKDTNNLVYSSSDSKVKAIADPTNSDTFTIKPNGIVKNGITITAIAQGDRNYKDTMKTATLNIAQAGTNQFTAIFPSMTYGDSGPFKVTIAPAGSGNETYTYVVKDTSIVDIDANGNITPHHAGTTTVDVTQTSTGGSVGPYTFTITVDPKPITITIEDKEKYTGMEMPEITVNIPNSDIVTGDTIPQPDFSCVDKNGFDVDANTVAGVYPITGSYVNPPSDYDITIVDGELMVTQDSASNSWYELQDASGNKTSNTVWHKDSVDIVLKPATGSAGTYDQIAKDTIFSNQDLTRFTVSEEGETTQDIYFRIDPNGSDPHKGAISLPIQDTIRIDKTDPIIKSITVKNASNSKVRQFLNAVTFGQFFKQGTIITIEAEDVSPSQGVAVSGIQKTSYEIKKLDEQGNGTPNKIDRNDDTIEISIKEAGTYEVCATATDQAGRESAEKCETFDIRKIDTDVDKDGKPDFNDPNEDGCADFNIVYKDEDGNWFTLNEDKDRDGVPEMNIDSDGDGKPDINVDTDKDGYPDINLLIITKDMWKPTQCVTQHGEQYASVMKITPQINVDTDGDGIPDINIDNNGDFNPDLNISNNGKDAQVNIVKLHEWKPKHDYTKDAFFYDSIGTDKDDPKREVNIDTDGDGRPDVNIDLDKDGKPDLNIDMDGDEIPDIDIDSNGDGKPNVNVDTNEDGKPDENIIEITEWNPKKDVDGKIPYDTMEITGKKVLEDNGVIVEKPDGNFLPNTTIKVKDVSDTIDTSIKDKIDTIAGEQEIKKVYDVEYLENNITKQPDGSVKVKIPVDPLVKNAKVVVEKEDGTFEEVNVTEKDGYYVFETEYIGKVSIIGDVEETKEPTPEPEPTTPEPSDKTNPSTSVQGSYTKDTSGVGGAYTGDTTQLFGISVLVSLSFLTLLLLSIRKKQE